MRHLNAYLATSRHLLAERARALWAERDRGSFSTEFAYITGAIIVIVILVVGLYKAFATDAANQIGNQ